MKTAAIGKFLVFINLVFSTMLFAFAVGVVTNRIDWAPPRTPGENESEYTRKREKIAGLQEVYHRVRDNWGQEQSAVAALETTRTRNEKWYADQLAILRTGTDSDGRPAADPAIKGLKYENQALKLDPAGLPELVPLPDPERLRNRKALAEEIIQKEDEIKREIEKLLEKFKQEEELTYVLIGQKGKRKGLRDLLVETQLAQKISLEQLLYMKPLRINQQVEAQRLSKRQAELARRIEELKKYRVVVLEP